MREIRNSLLRFVTLFCVGCIVFMLGWSGYEFTNRLSVLSSRSAMVAEAVLYRAKALTLTKAKVMSGAELANSLGGGFASTGVEVLLDKNVKNIPDNAEVSAPNISRQGVVWVVNVQVSATPNHFIVRLREGIWDLLPLREFAFVCLVLTLMLLRVQKFVDATTVFENEIARRLLAADNAIKEVRNKETRVSSEIMTVHSFLNGLASAQWDENFFDHLSAAIKQYICKIFGLSSSDSIMVRPTARGAGLWGSVSDAPLSAPPSSTFAPAQGAAVPTEIVIRIKTRELGDVLEIAIRNLPPGISQADIEPRLAFVRSLVTFASEARLAVFRSDVSISERVSSETIRDLQESLAVPLPTIPRTAMARHFSSAKVAGGDWMLVFHNRSQNTLRFFLGDVTGHGAPAVMLSAVTCGAVRLAQELGGGGQTESEALIAIADLLNVVVMDQGKGKLGMTLLCGSLNLSSGELVVVNMGSPFPLIFGPTSESIQASDLLIANSALGAVSLEEHMVGTVQLKPGTGIVMYTDGLTGNVGKAGDLRDIRKHTRVALASDQLIDAMRLSYLEQMNQLAKEPADDVAILAIQWLGNEEQK